MKNDNVTFYEYQRLKRWFLLLILTPINLIFIIGCVSQIGFGKFWGNNPMSDTVLIIVTVLMLLFTINMFFIRMETVVDCEGIHIRVWLCPFYVKSNSFLWENKSESFIKTSIRDYRNYVARVNLVSIKFIRIGPIQHGIFEIFESVLGGTKYIISGNTGLQLILTTGKKILIGTNNPDELSEALHKLGNSQGESNGERKGK